MVWYIIFFFFFFFFFLQIANVACEITIKWSARKCLKWAKCTAGGTYVWFDSMHRCVPGTSVHLLVMLYFSDTGKVSDHCI